MNALYPGCVICAARPDARGWGGWSRATTGVCRRCHPLITRGQPGV